MCTSIHQRPFWVDLMLVLMLMKPGIHCEIIVCTLVHKRELGVFDVMLMLVIMMLLDPGGENVVDAFH